MTIASAGSRLMCADVDIGSLIGILILSIAGATGIHPLAAAENTSAYIVPAQLSMGRNLWAPTPAARKGMTAPAKPQAGFTQQEQRQLAEAINQLTPTERKRLAKAVKRMTPEQRRQLVAGMKRQLARIGTASQLTPRAR